MPILGILASSITGGLVTDAGAMFPIRSYVVPSGGVASIEWTSIPSTYTHLQIRYIARYTNSTNSTDQFFFQFNSDTGSNYSDHILAGSGTSAFASADTSVTKIGQIYGAGGGMTANVFGAGVIDILDYANTNKYKTTRTLHGVSSNASSAIDYVGLSSGSWRSTSAITSIKFTPPSNNFAQYSSFALFGVLA